MPSTLKKHSFGPRGVHILGDSFNPPAHTNRNYLYFGKGHKMGVPRELTMWRLFACLGCHKLLLAGWLEKQEYFLFFLEARS